MENIEAIQKHNAYQKKLARAYAAKMTRNPSALEDRMANYFNIRGIDYITQKPLFITDKRGKIIKFFIADFYIQKANLIVEVDGKFHKEEQEYDNLRDELIKDQYKGINILRLTWHDLDNQDKLNSIFQGILFASHQASNYMGRVHKIQTSTEEYAMVFLENLSKLYELKGMEFKVLLCCWMESCYSGKGVIAGNLVYNDTLFKNKCREKGLKTTNAVFDNAFSILHRKGYLLKISKGLYMVNPLYAFKGTLSDRSKLLEELMKGKYIETYKLKRA